MGLKTQSCRAHTHDTHAYHSSFPGANPRQHAIARLTSPGRAWAAPPSKGTSEEMFDLDRQNNFSSQSTGNRTGAAIAFNLSRLCAQTACRASATAEQVSLWHDDAALANSSRAGRARTDSAAIRARRSPHHSGVREWCGTRSPSRWPTCVLQLIHPEELKTAKLDRSSRGVATVIDQHGWNSMRASPRAHLSRSRGNPQIEVFRFSNTPHANSIVHDS